MPLGDDIESGVHTVTEQLDAIENMFGREAALGHAAGIVTGARNWIVSKTSRRSAYELFSRLSDDIIDPIVHLATFEDELRETMRRRIMRGGRQ